MPRSYEVEKLADAPATITAGAATAEGRFYFIVNTHLWSLGLGE